MISFVHSAKFDKFTNAANQTKEHKQNAALSTSNRGHVMISYQWKNQKLIQKIRDRLQENGVKCWMDIDDMQGSTLYAMAKAVEDADIVLICYSKKYHESPNCRAGLYGKLKSRYRRTDGS